MTSYFDDAARSVRHLPRDLSNEAYLASVAGVEKLVVDDVLLNTGDREFPDDLREKILKLIATRGIYSPANLSPTDHALDYVLSMHYSELIEDLHSVFHDLARRRIKTRFGFWSDSPRANLVSRKCHDEPEEEERC